ncbi:Ubiquitin fusion degradation protein 1, partial [Tetrabaena socialis]
MVSQFELNARANKLLADQKARTEREKQRLEKERVARERARAREQEREEQSRRRKEEERAEEERRAEADFQEREDNRGVFLRVELQALPMFEASAKGVKRSKDKLILPPSVGASLMGQDASKNGAMLFQVALPSAASAAPSASSAAAGPAGPSLAQQQHPRQPQAGSSGRTHAGVLEFSAPEGTVLLPRKVAQSLYGSLDGAVHEDGATAAAPQPSYGTVVVSYRRLEKGSYVRMQPMSHGFHEAMEAGEGGEGGDGGWGLREVLEAELAGHSTLSEGDWVTVSRAGREWPLRVQELRPAAAVSIIDCDLEADVVPSLEAEEYLRQWEREQAAAAARLAALAAERAQREAAEAAEGLRQAAAAADAAAAEAAAAAALRQQLAAALPPEPELPSASAAAADRASAAPSPSSPSSAPRVFTCAFSLPDGSRLTRRFTPDQPAQLLFDFVDSRGAGGWRRGSYRLVTRMPRRVVGGAEVQAGRTLEELG